MSTKERAIPYVSNYDDGDFFGPISYDGLIRKGALPDDVFLIHPSGQFALTPRGGLARKFINKTGASSVKGTAIKLSSTYENSVEICNTANRCIGAVLTEGVIDGGLIFITYSGFAECLLKNSEGATLGHSIKLSNVDGRFTTVTNPGNDTKGFVLYTVTGGTDVLCRVFLI